MYNYLIILYDTTVTNQHGSNISPSVRKYLYVYIAIMIGFESFFYYFFLIISISGNEYVSPDWNIFNFITEQFAHIRVKEMDDNSNTSDCVCGLVIEGITKRHFQCEVGRVGWPARGCRAVRGL